MLIKPDAYCFCRSSCGQPCDRAWWSRRTGSPIQPPPARRRATHAGATGKRRIGTLSGIYKCRHWYSRKQHRRKRTAAPHNFPPDCVRVSCMRHCVFTAERGVMAAEETRLPEAAEGKLLNGNSACDVSLQQDSVFGPYDVATGTGRAWTHQAQVGRHE
jgi:hypothetical protein